MKINKITKFLMIFVLSFLFVNKVDALSADDYNYETELAKFPTHYQDKIKELHNIYPNAIFVADYPDSIGSKYKCSSKIYNTTLSFDTMVNLEYYDTYRGVKARSLLQGSDGYKSTESWSYNYYTNKFTGFSGGAWYAANKQTIIYYLNSLNFINEKNIFMFESLNYNSAYHTKDGVEKILNGTFMYNKECPGAEKTEENGNVIKLKYSDVLIEAAQKYDISPYFLASRLRQEQGVNKGSMVSGKYSGYEGYYNYFNVQANGSTTAEVIKAGLSYAKSKNWDTEYKAIIEGASFVDKEYVDGGQNTLYLQKFDATGTCWANHQYMQNISAPYTESLTTYNSYKSNSNYKNEKYVFFITVWDQQKTTTLLPNPGNPNNYLKNITVEGESIKGFDGKNETYAYNTSTNTDKLRISAELVANKTAKFYINEKEGTQEIALTGTKQDVIIKVVAGNGAIKNYKLTINRSETAPLTSGQIIGNASYKTDGKYISGLALGMNASDIKNNLQKQSTLSTVKITDSNNVEKTTTIATGDKVVITSGGKTDTYEIVLYGDPNGDGKISALDYVRIKNYIMGSKSMSGANKEAADANKDGTIDARDYIRVKNNIMGASKITQ